MLHLCPAECINIWFFNQLYAISILAPHYKVTIKKQTYSAFGIISTFLWLHYKRCINSSFITYTRTYIFTSATGHVNFTDIDTCCFNPSSSGLVGHDWRKHGMWECLSACPSTPDRPPPTSHHTSTSVPMSLLFPVIASPLLPPPLFLEPGMSAASWRSSIQEVQLH